jgi:hypothetical protein
LNCGFEEANAGSEAEESRRVLPGERTSGKAPAGAKSNQKMQMSHPRPEAPLYSQKLLETYRIEKRLLK